MPGHAEHRPPHVHPGKMADIPLGKTQAGEVRIKNHAAALNFFDILQIQGKYQTKPPLPFTPGAEVAGVVDAVGIEVNELAIGDRVMGWGGSGGFAEYTVTRLPRRFVFPTRWTSQVLRRC